MIIFNQEKFLLTKIPLDDRGYIDLMVLKFWLLNVQDKLLGSFSQAHPLLNVQDKLLGFFSQAQAQAHPHPLPLSSPSFQNSFPQHQ